MKSSSKTKPRAKADLDLIDRKILSILRDEGRLTVHELATPLYDVKFGAPAPPAVRAEVPRM